MVFVDGTRDPRIARASDILSRAPPLGPVKVKVKIEVEVKVQVKEVEW